LEARGDKDLDGLRSDYDAERGDETKSCAGHGKLGKMPGGRGKRAAARIDAGLTEQALSCAARAYVPKPMRHAACLHVSRAMQTA
jgi:hypothetical protein